MLDAKLERDEGSGVAQRVRYNGDAEDEEASRS